MKKTVVLIFCILLLTISLCGCNVSERLSADSSKYIIASLGFDEDNGRLNMYLEAIIVNSDDTEAEKKTELLEGNGKTLKEAFDDSIKRAAQSIELSHSAVAVIGKSISAARYKEICSYLYNERQITLSILLVSAESAKDLLSSQTVSSVAVGYDITGLIEQHSSYTGLNYKNRLYELENLQRRPVKVSAVPYFAVQDGKFFIDGVTVLKNGEQGLKLNSEETFIYCLAANAQSRGKALLESEEFEIKMAAANTEVKNGEFVLTYKIDTENNEIKQKIKQKTEELFSLSKTASTDLFGVGNILYVKEKDFFERINSDYYSFYNNLKLTVNVE